MNILYVAPDIPVPHTGEFVDGSTHVVKVAECMAERGKQCFYNTNMNEKKMKKIKRLKIFLWSMGIGRSDLCPLCKSKLEVYEWVKHDERWWTSSKRDKYEVYCTNPKCDFGKEE